MLEQHPCVTARCDECGQLFGENADGVLHFDTTADALEEITTPYDGEQAWVVVDGDGRLRCEVCEARRLCAERGHGWSEWLPCLCKGLPFADNFRAGSCPHEVRYCDRACCPAFESTHSTDSEEVTS
ncbi:hypothetical protein MOQ72_41865 [Saccharopolyspora sp. K220]|uniref:hypothetical protein n=1 Tax=Saccharopolyspora soli TaxID=2926618 RepID=UPI001F579BF9|nr:hypothetical protein [Saccharopolyspora soli]MCI2423966.1 hypothetical protein [Saccharopolyspora soli]